MKNSSNLRKFAYPTPKWSRAESTTCAIIFSPRAGTGGHFTPSRSWLGTCCRAARVSERITFQHARFLLQVGTGSALFLALLLTAAGCKNKDKVRVQTEEEPSRLASMLVMSDPRANSQLITGWYPLEQNAWRWTAGHFSVVLRPPIGSEQAGATLKLKLNVPQPVIDKMKSTSLTATVAGTALPPETYTKPGDYEFVREVPAAALKGDSVKVDFALDKFLAAGTVESRELGVIATAVGFEHK